MKLKRIIALVLALASVFAVMSMVSCNKNVKYVAKPIASTDSDIEDYGFAIAKDASKKDEILTAINEVIADLKAKNAIGDIVLYYDALSIDEETSITLDFPNLSDNTGGTLDVYTNAEFAPFDFRDNDQNIVGVDMYIMQLVAEKLNMKVEFHDIAFDAVVGKVATTDNAVGASGITILDERKEEVDFSDVYYTTVQCIISKEEGESFTKLEDLKGMKIGAQKGTTGAALIDEAIKNGILKGTGAVLVEYDSGPLAYTALKAGKCDVVVIDELPANQLVK